MPKFALVAIDGDNIDRTLFGELKSQLAPGVLVEVIAELLPNHTTWSLGCYTVPQTDRAMSLQQHYLRELVAAGIAIRRWRRGAIRGRTVGYPDSWLVEQVVTIWDRFDTLVLVTADRDYVPLLSNAQAMGKDTVVLSPQPVAWPSFVRVHELDWLDTQHPGLLRSLIAAPAWI
ncbi:MAG TPA: NYN domain-containing protein [Candidatus Saccharimonadales bacterium]|nr:NYN domain-containing protein [Candidatus Saccharimonadales bacterium]